MASNNSTKKRVAVSYKNLSPELLEEVKKRYPNGWTDHMIRIDKSPTDFFYAIMMETDEANYLIKVDVKVDDGNVEEEEDKEYYDDEIKGAEEIADDGSDDSMDD
ncbi:MAG: hypothetical protein LBM20_04665 [Rikenellaceae bacterium]|jgi:hypothetical protein|nr:hypothetical protein [Rikenellaceae bacterium]